MSGLSESDQHDLACAMALVAGDAMRERARTDEADAAIKELLLEPVEAIVARHVQAAVTQALNDAADAIDRGPTFPLPPSVISALVREMAT